MSKMMAYDPELGAWLAERISAYGYPAEKKRMFGHETWFLNTHMFTGANELGIFVHIGRAAVEEALASLPGVDEFVPGRGMTMKDYLILKKAEYEDEGQLKSWLDRSSAYLSALPPKEKKAKKKKT